MSDTIKGGIRGLTADVMGGPVDLATILANLGVAGTGYLAHKLRLIDQPPDLIDPKDVPFSSDWHVKNSPLEDPGTADYTAGRLTGNLLPLFAAAAAKVKPPVKGQTNALYPGGSKDNLLYTSSYPEGLLRTTPNGSVFTEELYSPSAAIQSKERILEKGRLNDDFGTAHLILNPRKFEPRVSPTVIKNRDFWSPRRLDTRTKGDARDFLEQQADYRRLGTKSDDDLKERARFEALLRLSDRFVTSYANAGVRAEGNVSSTELRNRLLAPYQDTPRTAPKPPYESSMHTQAMLASPRFQSFKHFEQSPAGAATLRTGEGPSTASAQLDIDMEYFLRPYQDLVGDVSNSQQRVEAIKRLLGSGGLPLQKAARAADLLKQLRELPSNYAEVKTFGSVPLSRETVATAIIPETSMAGADLARMLRRKGIEVAYPVDFRSAEELFDFAESMQSRALKDR